MLSLSALIVLYIVVILLGKQVQRPQPGTSMYVTVLALAQTLVVLLEMLFTDLPMF